MKEKQHLMMRGERYHLSVRQPQVYLAPEDTCDCCGRKLENHQVKVGATTCLACEFKQPVEFETQNNWGI